MAKKDYKAMASGIIKQAGGADNIVSATHCMTRLRLVLRDKSKFDTDAVKQVPGVLNVIIQNGEYQVVIGQDVPDLYEEVVKIDGIQAGGSVQDDEAAAKDLAQDHGNIGNAILSFIGGTFSPVIPVLVAGGLTGAVLSLLTNVFGVSAESGTYTIFYAINQATFYFLPIFIGFAAAARLKSNGFLGAFLGAILLYSSINGAEGLDFFGIPVQAISYNSTVFPVILGVLFMSVVYKFLQKHIPVFLKTIVVPLLTMLITVPVTLIVLGPIGNTVGTWLANGVYALYQAVPALAVMVIGITTPLMVFFGMNNATYPVVFALMAAVNSDPLICTGMAPGKRGRWWCLLGRIPAVQECGRKVRQRFRRYHRSVRHHRAGRLRCAVPQDLPADWRYDRWRHRWSVGRYPGHDPVRYLHAGLHQPACLH